MCHLSFFTDETLSLHWRLSEMNKGNEYSLSRTDVFNLLTFMMFFYSPDLCNVSCVA